METTEKTETTEEIKIKSELYNMLSMIDPIHSIILNDKIGLIGNTDCETNKFLVDALKIGEITRTKNYTICKRGDYFNILSETAELLFDEHIIATYVLYKNEEGNEADYYFILKDYKAIDEMNKCLYDWGLGDKEDIYKPAVIAYKDGKLYTNCDELKEKYILDKGIQLEPAGDCYFKLLHNGKAYTASILSDVNNIYKFNLVKMHL